MIVTPGIHRKNQFTESIKKFFSHRWYLRMPFVKITVSSLYRSLEHLLVAEVTTFKLPDVTTCTWVVLLDGGYPY